MSRRPLVAVLGLLLVLAVAAPAFAAVDDDIRAIQEQITELRKQLIDKYVERGDLTREQGEYIKDGLEQERQYAEKYGNRPGYGPAFGVLPCHNWGAGGFSMGGMMRGWYW